MRQLSTIDNVIGHVDRALRSVTSNTQPVDKPSPAQGVPEADLDKQERQLSLGLMRVNHAGEVCAQALYQGQGISAKLKHVRAEMERAADEEIDHLAWCEQRIEELGGRTSLLNPVWYSMSFTMGAAAGFIGDKVSLGFVAATEDQVSEHLKQHLSRLPEKDIKSRKVVTQMLDDEQRHAQTARQAGAYEFPSLVKSAMTLTSKVMTTLSYRL